MKCKRRKRRKASIGDVVFIGIFMLVMGLVVITCHYVLDQLKETEFYTDYSYTHVGRGQEALASFNNTLIVIAVILAVVALGWAMMSPAHPVFLIVGILTLAFSMTVVPQVTNVYLNYTEEFGTMPETVFPKIHTFMANLPMITAALGAFILMVQYAKLAKA